MSDHFIEICNDIKLNDAWSGYSSFSELSLQNINFLHSMNQVMLAD